MPTDLLVAPGFTLPLGLVVQKAAILARSGAGKTNTAVVIVEELLTQRQQVVILDPPGAWWGLRSSADGTEDGHSVLIFGGEHQDVPLDPEDGERVALLLVQTKFPAILDLSEFTIGETTKFVEAFAKALYELKGPQAARSPLFLVAEEADEMAPQVAQPDQRRMLGAMERIAKRGRMRGIGLLAVTQRSASLNKNVLSQIEVLIAMQTTDPRDIDAIDAWLKRQPDQEARKQLLAEIAGLQRGEAFVWSPAWLSIFQKVRFRKRATYDSSATPDPLVDVTEGPQRIATVSDMMRDMKPYIAAVSRGDEKNASLEAQIAVLRADLREAQEGWSEAIEEIAVLRARPDPQIVVERVPLLDEASFQELQGMVGRFEGAMTDLSGALARATIEGILEKNDQSPKTLEEVTPIHANSRQFPPISGSLSKPKEDLKVTPRVASERGPLGKAERTLLTALYGSPFGRTKIELTLMTGYSDRSSTFSNAISGLRVREYLRDSVDGTYEITDQGNLYIEVHGGESGLPRHAHELFPQWTAKLGKAERLIFQIIYESPERDEGVRREAAATLSGYSINSSTFSNALSTLRTKHLIQGSKMLKLSDTVVGLLGKR